MLFSSTPNPQSRPLSYKQLPRQGKDEDHGEMFSERATSHRPSNWYSKPFHHQHCSHWLPARTPPSRL